MVRLESKLGLTSPQPNPASICVDKPPAFPPYAPTPDQDIEQQGKWLQPETQPAYGYSGAAAGSMGITPDQHPHFPVHQRCLSESDSSTGVSETPFAGPHSEITVGHFIVLMDAVN